MWRKVLLIALVGYASAYPMDVEGTIEAQRDAITHARRAMMAAHHLKRTGGWTDVDAVPVDVAIHFAAVGPDTRRTHPSFNGLKRTGGWTAVADGASAIVDPVPIAGPVLNGALHTAGAVLDATQGVLENGK